jgi:hypothetical protein
LRGGDDDAPVTRTQVDQKIVRADLGQVEHLLDHYLRRADVRDLLDRGGRPKVGITRRGEGLPLRRRGQQRHEREGNQATPPHAR